MSKKLPKGLGKGALDIAGDVIEGAGSALGGIAQGIGSAVGGIAQGAGAALGGALQGALTEPNVIINNMGAAGAYAKSKVKTTTTMSFSPVQKLEYSEEMPLEKLMVVAIKYLSGISKQIKNQNELEVKNARKQELLDKENLIEQNSPSAQLESVTGKTDKSKNVSGLLKGLGLGAGLLAASTIDMSGLERLGQNLEQFKKDYGWLADVAFYGGIGYYLLKIPGLGKLVWNIVKSGSMAAAEAVVKGATFLGASGIVSATGAVGAVAGGLYATDQFIKNQAKTTLTPDKELEAKYGIKRIKTESAIGSFTSGFEVNGKKYNNDNLPAKYREIVDSYTGQRGAGVMSKEEVDKKYASLRVKESPAGKTGYANDIYQFFISRGYTEEQAKGIAAGIHAESKSDHNIRGGYKGRAVGLGQWLGPRRDELFRRYGENPTRQQQLEFLDYELRGGDPGGKAVLAQNTEKGVLGAYINKFMRPAPGSETTKDLHRGMAALGRGGEDIPGSDSPYSVGGALQAGAELVQESFDAVIKAVKKIGTPDTKFKPKLTASTPKFNKTDKLIEDSVKFQAALDLGKKEDVKKQNPIAGDIETPLRKINNGVLDVIDPNYRMDKNGILTSYIMSFKEVIV